MRSVQKQRLKMPASQLVTAIHVLQCYCFGIHPEYENGETNGWSVAHSDWPHLHLCLPGVSREKVLSMSDTLDLPHDLRHDLKKYGHGTHRCLSVFICANADALSDAPPLDGWPLMDDLLSVWMPYPLASDQQNLYRFFRLLAAGKITSDMIQED